MVRDAEVVILATPSAYLKDFLAPLSVSLKDKFIVSAIKGDRPGDYQTVVGVYPRPLRPLLQNASASSRARRTPKRVSRGKLSYLTVVCTDLDNAHLIGSRFAGGTSG